MNVIAPILMFYIIVQLIFVESLTIKSNTVVSSRILRLEEKNANPASISRILKYGGKTTAAIRKKGKEKTSGITTKIKDYFRSILPITRIYLFLTLFCTVIHLIGLPAPKLFALDLNKLYEIWRPVTAISYFGTPSMSMANSLYFLISYGQTLEREYGPGTHAWFLTVETALLTLFGFLLNFPFLSQSMIAGIVYVCSRLHPMQQIPFQFGFMITSWQLPFCMMIIDCLSQQSPEAAWPHVLGILSGHIYYFFTEVWPTLGGKEYLQTPKLFTRLFGDKASSNIETISSSKSNRLQKKSVSPKNGRRGLLDLLSKKTKGKSLK